MDSAVSRRMQRDRAIMGLKMAIAFCVSPTGCNYCPADDNKEICREGIIHILTANIVLAIIDESSTQMGSRQSERFHEIWDVATICCLAFPEFFEPRMSVVLRGRNRRKSRRNA